MAEGYTKLFSGIVMSTVWTYDSDTKVVWVTLLAMADERGQVVGTIPGLAKMAGVSIEAARRAMGIFIAPDPDSGSKEFDGRRIEAIDRGWRLLTHAKYRALRSREEKLEADRLRIATKRAETKTPVIPGMSQESQSVAEVAHAEAEASAESGSGSLSGSSLPALKASDPDPETRAIPLPQAPYVPPRALPRVDRFAAATSGEFHRVLAVYPRKDDRVGAEAEFQVAAASHPGGEKGLADEILAAFPVLLKRHPYNGPNATRPFLGTVIKKKRWLDPESAPDDLPSAKSNSPPRGQPSTATREAGARLLARLEPGDQPT